MATPVTPIPLLAAIVITGNTAVTAIAGGPNGGFMQNPSSSADQGGVGPEDIVVNPVSAAVAPGIAGGVNGTNFRIAPGGSWTVIAGQTTPTSVNAASSGHKFAGVSW